MNKHEVALLMEGMVNELWLTIALVERELPDTVPHNKVRNPVTGEIIDGEIAATGMLRVLISEWRQRIDILRGLPTE